jgi:hypothetical protein
MKQNQIYPQNAVEVSACPLVTTTFTPPVQSFPKPRFIQIKVKDKDEIKVWINLSLIESIEEKIRDGITFIILYMASGESVKVDGTFEEFFERVSQSS